MITKAKKKFLKILIITLSTLLVLGVIAFWLVTSSWFITGVILPSVSSSAGLRINARDVNLSLFSGHLTANKLVIGSDKNPLVKAEKLDGSFSLGDLLGGRLTFRDVLLDKAVITIAKDSDGNWTYESPEQTPESPSSVKTPDSEPAGAENKKPEKTFIDLKNIQIKDSSFTFDSGDKKTPARMEFKNLNINLSELKNNKPGNLTIKSSVSVKSNSGITVDEGDWNATLTVALNDYMQPYQIKLDSNLDKLSGIINGVKINNSNLAMRIDGDGDEKGIVIKEFYLRELDGKYIKTNIELNSYISFVPFKIKGKIKIAPLSSEVSTVLCQFTRQINPGKVGASLISDFEYSDREFSGAGILKLTRRDDAIIGGKKYKLPNLSFRSKYDFNYDQVNNVLRVKHMNTELNDRDKKVLSLYCDRPFTYSIGKLSFLEKRKPEITLELRNLDLTLMKLLQPPGGDFVINKGHLNGDIACVIAPKRKLRFGGNIRAEGLDFQLGENHFEDMGFEQKIVGLISRQLFLSLPKFDLNIISKKKNILSFVGSGSVDFKKSKAEFAMNMKGLSREEIRSLPLPLETIKGISKITGKLNPFFLTAALHGSVQFDKGDVKLGPVDFNIVQQDKKVLNISVTPHDGEIKNLTNNSKAVLTLNNLSTRQFRGIIEDDTLAGGYLNGRIVADIKNNLKSIVLNSSLTVDYLTLLRMNKLFKNLRFNLGFTSSINNFDEIKIRQVVCGMRKNKRLIMGLSGFGDLKLSKGEGKFELALNYLNHESINIITPGSLKHGILKGKLDADIKNHFKDMKIKSNINMRQVMGGSVNEAVGGSSSFDMVLTPDLFFCKKFSIDVNSKSGKIVSIDGSTTLPQGGSRKPVVINLKSKIIDIDKIKKLFATKDVKQAEPKKASEKKTAAIPRKAEPVKFDFGKKSYVLLVDLRGIKYSSMLTAHLNSKITGEKRHLSVKHLQITGNEDKLNFKGDFLSTKKGVKYDVELKSDKFNLSPVFNTFLRNDLKRMKGTLKNVDMKLAGTGLQPPVLWDNINGSVRSDFENVKIPNSLSKTTMGKIFLLPFEIMVNIQGMVPGKVVKAMGRAAQYVVDFQNDMKILNFTDGKMRLEAGGGTIRVIDFHLNGKIVSSISFIGEFGLGTRQMLDMKSQLNMNKITLPVEISGTVDKPEINYRATTVKFMTENAFSILDTTGEILEKSGGDAKKILDKIFD